MRNPAMETWQDPYKKFSREKISDAMTEIMKLNKFPKNINCLSLPAHKWFFEVDLALKNSKRNFGFLALEKDENVLENQVGESLNLNKKIQNATFTPYSSTIPYDIESYLRVSRNLDFEIIYLDFMGNWSAEKEYWIEDIFIKNIKKKQYILAFTTSVIRTHKNNQEKLERYAKLISKELYNSRNNLGRKSEDSKSRDLYFYGVNGFIYQLAKKYNKEVKIHTPIEYINKSGRLQMVFLYRIVN